MTITNYATAKYEGLGKNGKGSVSSESGAFSNQPYGFNTRFEDKKGTNPEE
jgi:osmotically inducible protein OsmC